jgi:hypothetical protein
MEATKKSLQVKQATASLKSAIATTDSRGFHNFIRHNELREFWHQFAQHASEVSAVLWLSEKGGCIAGSAKGEGRGSPRVHLLNLFKESVLHT